jgi:hypothetical protein
VQLVLASFGNSGGAVVECELPTGACQVISNGNNGSYALATDGSFVYYLWPFGAGGASGLIREVPVGGGAKQVIAVGGTDLQDIAVDATSVYWINREAGTVLKVTAQVVSSIRPTRTRVIRTRRHREPPPWSRTTVRAAGLRTPEGCGRWWLFPDPAR